MSYIIKTRDEFKQYCQQFKISRGVWNLSGFLEVLGSPQCDINELPHCNLFNQSYIISSYGLAVFLHRMVNKRIIHPMAVNDFFVGTNHICNYSLNENIGYELTTLFQNKGLLQSMLQDGIKIINVGIPRNLLMEYERPADENMSVARQYIHIFNLYATLSAVKFNARQGYDVFKYSIFTKCEGFTNTLELFDELDYALINTTSKAVTIPNSDRFTIFLNEDIPQYPIYDLISLGALCRLYICKVVDDRVIVGKKRQYIKKQNIRNAY